MLRAAVAIFAGLAIVSLALEYGFHEDPERAPLSQRILLGIQLLTVLLFVAEHVYLVVSSADRKAALKKHWVDLAIIAGGAVVLAAQFGFARQPILKASTIYVITLQALIIGRFALGAVHVQLAVSQTRMRPAHLLAASFAVAIVIGGLLLSLPRAVSPELREETGDYLGKHILNCFFTSTSATCVTGLVVYDTQRDFTRFGQIVILALIQLGGLGIMVFGSVLGMLAGRYLSLRHSLVLQDAMSHRTVGQVARMVRLIVLMTFGCEAVGAAVLYPMWPESIGGVADRVFYSVFHAVSAFCNAGFALSADSVIPYRGAWGVYASIMPLIILGGLGFPVLDDLWGWCRSFSVRSKVASESHAIGIPRVLPGRRRYRFTLHTRLVLITSLILIVVPAAALFLFESTAWRRPSQIPANRAVGEARAVMGDMPAGQRAAAALFQSVTTRTAGFNTAATDLDSMSSASHFLMCLLMFIGGSPASTAGGVKTVALAVMVLGAYNALRRRPRVESFGRTVPDVVVRRAGVVIIVMLAVVASVTLGLSYTERGVPLEEVMFESVSACGTVGLSTGLTGRLTIAGRVIIMAAMFAGRLGPLTLLVALAGRHSSPSYDYPEEPLIIG